MQGSSHLGGSSTQPSQASLTVSGILWVLAGPQNLLSALREWRGGGNPRCHAARRLSVPSPGVVFLWPVQQAQHLGAGPGAWSPEQLLSFMQRKVPRFACLFIVYLWRRKNKDPVALATRSFMGCFPCSGKLAKSSCVGHSWACVYPDRGWGRTF